MHILSWELFKFICKIEGITKLSQMSHFVKDAPELHDNEKGDMMKIDIMYLNLEY